MKELEIWERTDISSFKNPYEFGTKKYKLWSALSMLNSCFCYGTVSRNFFDEEKEELVDYGLEYSQGLDRKKFVEIVKKRLAFLRKHTRVTQSVYTDDEGCTYNSMQFV